MKNKIVIIGSSGLVGENFCHLYQKMYDIVKIDHKNFKQKLAEIKNDETFFCKSVVFTAQSSDYKNQLFSQDLFDTNLSLLRESLEVFINKTEKFIYFSSGSVYESSDEEVDEKTRLSYENRNPYIISKITAEMLVNTFEPFYKQIVTLRPFFIYGKQQNEQMLFKQLINKLINNKEIEIGQDGGLLFNPIYVNDVNKILKVLIDSDSLYGRIINICGNEQLYLKDIIEQLAEFLQVEAKIIVNDSKVKKFTPKSSFEFITDFTPFTEGILDFENYKR